MRSTLFYIPAEVAGMPVFGVGLLLAVWAVLSLIALVWWARQPKGSEALLSYGPFLAIIAGIIVLLLPNMVERDPSGALLGIPIRGFGVMLMLATIAGVGLAAYRARQMGLDPEVIYSLAFCMFIAGILGARLFYLGQYWYEFVKYTPERTIDIGATLRAAVNVTQGGLVVYGAVMAAVPAGIWYLRRRGLPVLAVGDIIAPSMALGLAIGRIGCFLNGCCFGGVCLTADYAVTFPASSPPYVQQVGSGWHSGVWVRGGTAGGSDQVVVAYVAPGGAAEKAGVAVGQEITRINGTEAQSVDHARKLLAAGTPGPRKAFEIATAEGNVYRWTADSGPASSVPVHPAQLYAAIDAALLALLLWAWYPFRRRDGEVFALLVTIHPVSRFLLELIRSDEPGQFGTWLTISQWLSFGILAFAALLWWYIERRPTGSALPLEAEGPLKSAAAAH